MEQPVASPAALEARVEAAAQAAGTEITRSVDRPEGEPAARLSGAFDERTYWVSEGRTARLWSVLGVPVERVDVLATGATRRRTPLPAFGSPELQAWLVRHDFFVLPASGDAAGGAAQPWGPGLLFARRRQEQPGGLFWLGGLERSALPPITSRILDFEGAEVFPVGSRGKLALTAWPRCSYRGKELDILGAWHDWKLVLGTRPSGIWTYATLAEQLDFVAGDVLTWLETLAHGEVLRAENRLPIEIGFLFGRASDAAGRGLAGALGLTEDPLRTGTAHASFHGERLWLRALSPSIGRPFVVVRCEAVEDALNAVDQALLAGLPASRRGGVARPPRVALSSWSPQQPELRAAFTARGCEVTVSSAMWWGDLGAGRR